MIDLLDKYQVVQHRLFREHCTFYKGNFVKDLSRLGRDMKSVIIVDNSEASYAFQPENAVPCESWFDNQADQELQSLLKTLEQLAKVDDVIEGIETLL